MTSHGLHSILPYWKIVYFFNVIEWNRLKLCMHVHTDHQTAEYRTWFMVAMVTN